MALEEGQIYGCPHCGAEFQVTAGAAPGKGGNLNPVCCCGREMALK